MFIRRTQTRSRISGEPYVTYRLVHSESPRNSCTGRRRSAATATAWLRSPDNNALPLASVARWPATRPPAKSVRAGPEPRYGTKLNAAPQRCSSNSLARWLSEPLPLNLTGIFGGHFVQVKPLPWRLDWRVAGKTSSARRYAGSGCMHYSTPANAARARRKCAGRRRWRIASHAYRCGPAPILQRSRAGARTDVSCGMKPKPCRHQLPQQACTARPAYREIL